MNLNSAINKIKSDRTLWEEEWRKKIDDETDSIKFQHEKELNDLKFQKRLLEISLYKSTNK